MCLYHTPSPLECFEAEWLDDNYGQGKTTKGNQYTGKVPKRNLTKMPVPKKESARANVLRELIERKFPAGGDRKSKSNILTLISEGITKNQSSDAKILKEEVLLAEEVMTENQTYN